ncbi:WhiB family transcriptional regulator [Mycolicibacterium setense]
MSTDRGLRNNTAALPRYAEEWNWQLAARCRGEDPALFFPPDGERPSARQRRHLAAKAVCADCPVTVECRRHSLVLPETFGIWGGLSEAERAKVIGMSRDHNRHTVDQAEER